MIPRFDTLEQAQDYVDSFAGKNCHPHPICLDAVYITEESFARANVDRAGWYLTRIDLRRLLPLKHIIVRRGLDEPNPAKELPRDVAGCAATEGDGG